jgi:hypothetical protein
MNNHYLDILKYLTPDQLDDLYNRNLNYEINYAILKLRRNNLIKLLSVTDEQIRVIEEIKLIERKKNTNDEIITETRDSLEAAQYVVHGCNVIYDENRKIYLIKDLKNK